ncbi:MAG: type II CAAX endopeptidase family protein [Anaerolineae bacterium]|jgi:membrane protease YdiL (CAAX protease family)
MNPITSFIKRYPQGTFWGIVWAANFLFWYLASKYPSDLWLLGISAVLLTGVLVTAIADGRAGLKTYFSRIVRWRVGLKWYAVALFLPLVLRLAAFGLNLASGATLSTNIQWPAWSELIAVFLFIFFTIALFEEPGFRGFALPRLLIGRSALAAGLILGVLHTIWHLPNFITGDDAPVVVLIIIGGAVLNTWLFNNTSGSVFMAMLLHASVNLWAEVFSPFFSGADAERQTIWLAVGFAAMAILLPILTGRELGRKPETAMPAIATDQPAVAR